MEVLRDVGHRLKNIHTFDSSHVVQDVTIKQDENNTRWFDVIVL